VHFQNRRLPRVFRNLGAVLITLYGIGVAIAVPVFNWQYARENGFWRWLLLGEVVATLKATIWPYYLCTGATAGNQRHDGLLERPPSPSAESQIQ
jgi:hypothetical protein